MIKKLVRNIRRKPKSTRDNVALSIAASFTALVLAFWVYNTPVRMAAIEERRSVNAEESDSSSFSGILEEIGSQMGAVAESFNVSDLVSEYEGLASTTDENVVVNATSTSSLDGGFASSSQFTWEAEPKSLEPAVQSGSTTEQSLESLEKREVRIQTTPTATSTSTST